MQHFHLSYVVPLIYAKDASPAFTTALNVSREHRHLFTDKYRFNYCSMRERERERERERQTERERESTHSVVLLKIHAGLKAPALVRL